MTGPPVPRPATPSRAAYVLALCTAATALLAGLVTWIDADLLLGPEVMNGSARGTAAVVVVLAVPVLFIGTVLVTRGELRGAFLWAGALAYLTYNALMFLFATPYNRAFLLYVAMLAAAVWGLIALLVSLDTSAVRLSDGRPLARPVAVYVWVVAGLNTLVWLRGILPAVFGDPPGQLTEGMGVATNPVYVQDLALWLPAAVLSGVWLWQRRAWGLVLAASVLVFWTLESIGVAVDQWFGHRADPASDLASSGGSILFIVLALISGSVAGWLIRRVEWISPASVR